MKLLKSEGKLQDVDTTAATFSLLGMISWLSRWFRQNGLLDSRAGCRADFQIALNGLLQPEASRKSPPFE
jgi:hypothetical protein